VAIKKVFQDKRYKNREHQIIQDINHPNCVKLRDQYFTQGKNEEEVYLNLVMNYVPETLYSLIKKYNKKKEQIPPQLVKLYAYQMFRSLAYIDGIGVCHRDIKPSNVLVDPQSHLI
jgi:serine/threonine protein kinase